MFICRLAPTWFTPSDQQDRITARSSTCSATCGYQSETHSPLWPCCFHFRCEATSGIRCDPVALVTGRSNELGVT